ncbi:hypothetical protein KBY28_21040 [Ruegeria pomeroyi]|uniref:hypothetical protein n=1 Tax=Ruegeria pomeroyi TaxID=89184 RepID=UPI001F30674D|nr:hypothetical protein [Ruegeria pomeroyi]MCE8510944.1 hypothetical protein [Ruegeria pomeroyi]
MAKAPIELNLPRRHVLSDTIGAIGMGIIRIMVPREGIILALCRVLRGTLATAMRSEVSVGHMQTCLLGKTADKRGVVELTEVAAHFSERNELLVNRILCP